MVWRSLTSWKFSLIQILFSRLTHSATWWNQEGERQSMYLCSCVESKSSNSEPFEGQVCFNQRSPFILPYFIFHTGALFSSLQLKYLDRRQRQWNSAVALGQLGKLQLNVGSTASFRTQCDIEAFWTLLVPLPSFVPVLLIALSLVCFALPKVSCFH